MGRACARLALTTSIGNAPDTPPPFSRAAAWRLMNKGAIDGLALRNVAGVEEAQLERARLLLARVGQVFEAIMTYEKMGFRLILPDMAQWPERLRALGSDMPLFLFAMGDMAVMGERRMAVAGSRRILRETRTAAERTGEMLASEGYTLVTGGAQGVDSASLIGALRRAGSGIIIPARTAAQTLEAGSLKEAVHRGKLLLLFDSLPDEPFSAFKALRRNHSIYALGEAALVVAAREERGGSWRGATDCLRSGWSPVYVWEGSNADTAGNAALKDRGAGVYKLDKPLGEQIVCSGQIGFLSGE